jgi:hypothetical protein
MHEYIIIIKQVFIIIIIIILNGTINLLGPFIYSYSDTVYNKFDKFIANWLNKLWQFSDLNIK